MKNPQDTGALVAPCPSERQVENHTRGGVTETGHIWVVE